MSYVAWMLESTINDRAALDSVMANMGPAVEASESGTTHYESSLSADESRLVNYERFEDSAAAMTHVAAFGPFAERYLAAVKPTRFIVFGSRDRERLAAPVARASGTSDQRSGAGLGGGRMPPQGR